MPRHRVWSAVGFAHRTEDRRWPSGHKLHRSESWREPADRGSRVKIGRAVFMR